MSFFYILQGVDRYVANFKILSVPKAEDAQLKNCKEKHVENTNADDTDRYDALEGKSMVAEAHVRGLHIIFKIRLSEIFKNRLKIYRVYLHPEVVNAVSSVTQLNV